MPKLLVASQIVSLAQLLLFTAVRTSSAVFVDFGFPPGVRPALAGFLLFQQLIGPVDEARQRAWRCRCMWCRLGRTKAARHAVRLQEGVP